MEEPQKLAEFLRTRCERRMYGLEFLDEQHQLIYIPWPVAPRPGEHLPPEFQMFREWAGLSFRKRGNGSSLAEMREAPTNQKHRFRNALVRANGLKERKDIAQEGGKVFQFVAESKRSKTPAKASSVVSVASCSPPSSAGDLYHHLAEASDVSPLPPSKFPYSPSDKKEEEFQNQLQAGCLEDYADEMVDPLLTNNWSPMNGNSFLEDLLAETSPLQVTKETETEVEMMTESEFSPIDYNATVDFNEQQQQQQNHQDLQLHNKPTETFPNESFLSLKVHYRSREASAGCSDFCVSNASGCRLYFGNNIHNFSTLLDPNHLQQILQNCRRNQHELFGPNQLQQIRLPDPTPLMRTNTQLKKTSDIINNMDRGLLLWMDWTDSTLFRGIPDVMALRLCQTRIFPFEKDYSPSNCQPGSLKRLEPVRVFSAQTFCQQLDICLRDQSCQYPSTSFSFALGQRVPERMDDLSNVLASCTVTVERARTVLDSVLDGNAVCISDVNSGDQEARWLTNIFINSCRLDSCD